MQHNLQADSTKPTYFSLNPYGFRQKRFTHEIGQQVTPVDPSFPLEHSGILNASDSVQGKVSQFVALDSEYDACMDTNLKIPCKITIVNERGEVIIDTLINQSDEHGRPRRLQRMVAIHGITDEVLADAPTFKEVRAHLYEILDPQKIIIVGHSIKQDLLVMELTGFNFIDTSLVIDPK